MPVYIDISRCIGCRSCEVACQRVHGGSGHINVHFVGDQASVPIFCHHCEEASCTIACFTEALHKEGERTAFDVEKCTGCESMPAGLSLRRGLDEQDRPQMRSVRGPRTARLRYHLSGQCFIH